MPASPSTVTARGRARREALLNATAELVAQRGFHSVGIADIGAAAGVTGAAIYRHFATKQDLLVALIERVVDELLDGARTAVRESQSSADALERLVDRHVAFALRDRAIIAVYDQEIHHLPDPERRRLRRQQRTYTEIWVSLLADVRPELASADASAVVHGVFGLLNSVADYDARLPRDQLAARLTSMARAALAA